MAKKSDWPPGQFTKRWFDLEMVKMLQFRLTVLSGLELEGLARMVSSEIDRRNERYEKIVADEAKMPEIGS